MTIRPRKSTGCMQNMSASVATNQIHPIQSYKKAPIVCMNDCMEPDGKWILH